MLIKKRLKNIPPCKRPETSPEGIKEKYLAGAQICEIDGCGRILIVDYYNSKDGMLQVRFFCDKKNYIKYQPQNDKWSKGYLLSNKELDGSCDTPVYADKKSIKTANDFLNEREEISSFCNYSGRYSRYVKGMEAVIDRYIYEQEREQRAAARDRRDALFNERIKWFPKYDANIDRFCNERAFDRTYIFFSNLDKQHKRECVCSHCGKRWKAQDTIKHRNDAVCPYCGCKAIYIAERYQHTIEDKTTICTAYKHEGQLIMRWAVVSRNFNGYKPHLQYCDDAYTFYLIKGEKTKVVSYFLSQSPYSYGYTWAQKNNETCYHDAFIYDGNINETFGSRYHNVDLKKALSFCKKPINFIGLLDRLKAQPQAEYMCKLGLTELASVMMPRDYAEGKTFEEILSVSKQYITMYREMSVSLKEHNIIKATKEHICTDVLMRYRKLNISSFARTEKVLAYMTLDALCAYVERQAQLGHYSVTAVIEHLADYYDMLEVLKIPINKHTVRPRDLKKSHDLLVERYNIVKTDMENMASKRALEYVNRWFNGYVKDGLCIRIPHEKADFLREGQTLSHCVGSDSYYQNHINGKRMIFFIRQSKSPDTAYYTAGIDMCTFNVLQCYGFGDKPAPKEIRRFINGFAGTIKQTISGQRKAG